MSEASEVNIFSDGSTVSGGIRCARNSYFIFHSKCHSNCTNAGNLFTTHSNWHVSVDAQHHPLGSSVFNAI